MKPTFEYYNDVLLYECIHLSYTYIVYMYMMQRCDSRRRGFLPDLHIDVCFIRARKPLRIVKLSSSEPLAGPSLANNETVYIRGTVYKYSGHAMYAETLGNRNGGNIDDDDGTYSVIRRRNNSATN